MTEIQYVDEQDIRDIVEQECRFDIEDHGIGYYEHGDGKYNDKNLQLSLTTQDIMVQYPIDTESLIFTRIQGCYHEDDEYGEYECGWIAELTDLEWNSDKKCWDAKYEVYEG